MTPALERHYAPCDFCGRIAYAFVRFLRFFADRFFARRYGHRAVGYMEEEAVHSYTENLAGVDDGTYANVAAPAIAIEYWKLAPDARLHDVIIAVRADEAGHRDVNHQFADALA